MTDGLSEKSKSELINRSRGRFLVSIIALTVYPAIAEHKPQNTRHAQSECKTYPTGQTRVLSYGERTRSMSFSPDGRFVATGDFDGSTRVIELATGKVKLSLTRSPWAEAVSFSSDGRFVASVTKEGKATITEIETGKTRLTTSQKDSFDSVSISPDGRFLLSTSGGKIWVTEIATGKIKTYFSHSSPVKAVVFSQDGRSVISAFKDGEIRTTQLDNGKTVNRVTSQRPVEQVSFSADGRLVASVKYEVPTTVSADGFTTLKLADAKSFVKVIEVATGKVKASFSVSNKVSALGFSSDGLSLITGTSNGVVSEVSTATGKVRPLFSYLGRAELLSVSPDGKQVAGVSREGLLEIGEMASVCAEPVALTADQVKTIDLSSPEIASFCKAVFDPKVAAHDFTFRLLRFSKPGGIDLEKDAGLLLGVLANESFCSRNPELVRGILENLLLSSNQFYREVIRDFSHLSSLSVNPAAPFSCLTLDEEKKVSEAALRELSAVSDPNIPKASWEDYETLKPLTRFFSPLGESQKDRFIYLLTDKLANGAADTLEGSKVFVSKLYKVAKQSVVPLFGIAPHEVTDISLSRDREGIELTAVGSLPINGRQPNSFGIAFDQLGTIPIPAETKEGSLDIGDKALVQWGHGGKIWKAKIALIVGKHEELVDASPSIPYGKLTQDRKLTGLVMTGSNLLSGERVMDDYRRFYEKRGYRFLPDETVDDVGAYLKNTVSRGEVDYFVKEAHSDGDERNLFRFHKKARLKRGVKDEEFGESEVRILYSDTKSPTMLYSNAEFGSSIRSRKDEIPLVYLNTSCWSERKALGEIQAAGKGLIDICSQTIATTLAEGNATAYLVEGVIERDTYEQMRKRMSQDEGYDKRKTNYYLLPDQNDYKRRITDVVGVPITENVSLINPEGKATNIDELEANP